MKIRQWLGFNEESSQYLLRSGELRALVNLQPRRPGMLVSRPGLKKLYGKYDDESVIGLYRRDTLVGDPNDYLCLQKAIVDRVLTGAQIASGELPQELVYIIRRIQGYQERVIAQLPISPNGSTNIANFSVCEDRHGRLFLFFGHGAEPLMYRPTSLTNVALPMGMASPTTAPVVVPAGEGYFIESIDVTAGGGGGYYAPPTMSVSGGNPDRPAKVKGIVQSGNLVGVDVIDGGANYKTFPKVTVGTDKVGAGFRAVGNLETDPGVQGFVSTTPGAVAGTAAGAGETVGDTNAVLNNRIMYRTADVAAQTKTIALASPAAITGVTNPVAGLANDDGSPYTAPTLSAGQTLFMAVESVTGINPGDLITIHGSAQPAPFSSGTKVRVEAIDETPRTLESKQCKVIILSKPWTPAANTSYSVQFRHDASVGYADASWNPTTKRFRASVPLATTKGTGSGAEATLEFSPSAFSYGLGAFQMDGYTTPSGGVATPVFAWKQNGWDSYINDEFWQGSQQDKKDSKENNTYAGLQASGAGYVFGYNGTVSPQNKGKAVNKRADVYWPDYSKISVWLCTGALSDNINQWTRVDATVYDGNTSSPYAIVDLKPTASAKVSLQSGKLSFQTASRSYETADDFRYPKIKIKLRSCPQSWVTTTQTNGSYNYNLPFSVKESQSARLAWWHSAGITPRPIVDLYRGADGNISWESIEVLDNGAGWELGTVFGLRIHQANPYDQRTDYNTAVREQKVKGGHQPFSTSSRYAQFVFKATEADDSTPAGPPAALAGSQYVDVAGSGYRSGDTAEVTVLKRKLASDPQAQRVQFEAVMSSAGEATEYTYVGGVQQAGATLLNMSGNASVIQVGDLVNCTEDGVLNESSAVLSVSGADVVLDRMRNVSRAPQTLFYATSVEGADGRYYLQLKTSSAYSTATTVIPTFFSVGRKLRRASGGVVYRILEVSTNSLGGVVTGVFARVEVVSGAFVAENASYRAVFSFTALSGVAPAQTVAFTAEQIVAGTGEQRVTSIRIVSGGRDYFAPPTVLVRGGGNGYGLAVSPQVQDGKIVSCEITDPGRAYTAQPELYTDSSPATVVPVMRPTMRGKYRCAYRFVDRAESLVLATTITGVRGDSPTTLTLASTQGVEPGMLIESDRVPNGAKIVSVNGNQVDLDQAAIGSGYVEQIVIERQGTGYAQAESVTAAIAGAAGAVVAVTLSANDEGSYSVSSATIQSAGTTLFNLERIAVAFSPPAAGGAAATGYAVVTQLNPASTYSKSASVRDPSRPVAYSNFSPIVDIDAGPNGERQNCGELKWTLPGVTPPSRADMVELWRTSADQSLVFYRLEAYGIPADSGVEIVGTDTLNDEELYDPDRKNYAALPVVLPNGNLNAYRFGKPRTDMSVCVSFQDRLWFGVSTSGKDTNTLYYSEYDEFESCPDANDLPIQNNQKATDSLTALVPYGSMLLAMQNSHTYSVTYNTDPGVDGAIQMLTHRGCLHQRCFDMHNSVFYAVDESGIYSMDRSGNIQDISAPFREWFNSELIDFEKREAFYLTVCPKTGVLRFFCILKTMPEDTPTFALCFDVDRKTWWSEQYPNSFCSSVTARPRQMRINSSIFGGVDGNIYELNGDSDHDNQTLYRCVVTDGGKGYKRSPQITCPSSKGTHVKGVVSEGRLVDVLILSGGWDCKWGTQLLTESSTRVSINGEFPGNGAVAGGVNLMTPDGRLLQGVEYAPIVLDIEAPPAGGKQAKAVAHYSVTTKRMRNVTVSQGQSFVRIASFITDPIDTYQSPLIATEDGKLLCAVQSPDLGLDGDALECQSLPVEIGMEAIGDFLPLNAFVSKIVGTDIYLEHPDGTPVSLLGGDARIDANNDGYFEGGGTATVVYFFKPHLTAIPFRLATGAMQLLNEENINKGGDGMIDRSVSLVYTPTASKKEVEIIQYYNDSSTPRPNVMRRSRGGLGGFDHRQDSASTVLNMERAASSLADATGVAKAMFAGRVYTDATGEDQHIQVELHGRPHPANGGDDMAPQRFVMHSMTINGVIDESGE